jgi:3-oxoacyl-[acyl-carrier protein] reductase
MQLEGKIAVVTGGSRGIGQATALMFAREGADIAFCHLGDAAQAEATAGQIRALGRRVMARDVDVADIAAAQGFVTDAAREFGRVDILFNNAGMNIRNNFENVSEADFDRIVGVLFKGAFFVAQAAYRVMLPRKSGCIISTASQTGIKGQPGAVPYSAAKAAVIGMTRALAWEAAPHGIRVNAIAPGPIETDLVRRNTKEWQDAFKARLPVGRFGTVEEIAATALLLAGPHGGYYCGATLSPNGGDVMY